MSKTHAATWLSLAVLAASVVGICRAIAGCSSSCDSCIEAVYATMNLSCGPTDLEAIEFSGPCPSYGDGSVGDYFADPGHRMIAFGATATGTCHVTLRFASGFTYSTDVNFMEGSGGCSGCPNVLTPFPSPVNVNNPSSTCLLADAGAD